MASDGNFPDRFRARVRAALDAARVGAWKAGARLREGGRAAWRGLSSAPWRRIGVWAGGVFGVLAATLVLFVTFADWNALRGPIGGVLSGATGRDIVIKGNIDVRPWSFTPEISVENVTVGNPSRFSSRGAFAEIEHAEAALRLFPLLVGRFDVVRLDLRGADLSLYRNAEGDSNWSSQSRSGGGLADLPAIRAFSLRDGHLRYQDEQRKMLLDAVFTTEESADPERPGRFELNGEGELNNRSFSVTFAGAPLLNVRRNRPYEFVADIRMGGTQLKADGAIRRPFNFNLFDAEVEASGPDLADLYYLIGITLPNTPPYRLRGTVERDGRRFGMPQVSGRVGDSDVTGQWSATEQNGRRFFEGEFRSNTLDFDDLVAVLGGPPDTDETASAEQRAIAAQLAAQGRLLPDAPLDISRVRNMDASVSYRAAHVRSDAFPLRGLATVVSLDQGLLRLDPLTLTLSQGRIGGAVSINARQDTPVVALDVRLADARMESVLRMADGSVLSGPLHGRARLTGRGRTVRDAAATADGEISLFTPSGQVREAFAELTGINVARGLGLLLTDDQSQVGIRCGVASFHVTNGVARARTIVVDTETMRIGGAGSINLRNETIDLRIEGDAKEPRLIEVAAPITLKGRLRSPEVGVDIEEAAEQGGIAALLATVLAPLAAVIPFIDPGLAEDENCSALLANRGQSPREG